MKLTQQAIRDLRFAIAKSLGEDYEGSLSENDLQEIGLLLLTITREGAISKFAQVKT